jgi:hypothetical protein
LPACVRRRFRSVYDNKKIPGRIKRKWTKKSSKIPIKLAGPNRQKTLEDILLQGGDMLRMNQIDQIKELQRQGLGSWAIAGILFGLPNSPLFGQERDQRVVHARNGHGSRIQHQSLFQPGF